MECSAIYEKEEKEREEKKEKKKVLQMH